jgi:GNAT superfamily N-acetyltransferase
MLGADAEVLSAYRCLQASGMLVHHGRCYEDARCVPFAAFTRALAQLARMQIFSAGNERTPDGFIAVSITQSPAGAVGHIHFIVMRPDTDVRTAGSLLDRALTWCEQAGALKVRQARIDPVSSTLRVEQDRHLIDLLTSRGFAPGAVAGNMEIETSQFAWSDKLKAQTASVRAAGISIRQAKLDDVPAVRALNAQEGLALWDYHVDAMVAADAVGRLLLAEQHGRLVGYANFLAARWDTDLTEFGPLLVATDLRGAGLGSVLTAHALNYARDCRKKRLRLSTLRFDFYRALGFQTTVTWRESMERN